MQLHAFIRNALALGLVLLAVSGLSGAAAARLLTDADESVAGKVEAMLKKDPLYSRFKAESERSLPLYVFIPGLMGSKIEECDNQPGGDNNCTLVWGEIGWGSLFKPTDISIKSHRVVGTAVLDKFKAANVGIKNVYGEGLAWLAARNSPDRKNLIQFSYDWRQDNAASARDLQALLCTLTPDQRERPVIFVAHSMGGLVLKYWFAKLYQKEKCSDGEKLSLNIQEVMFLGTPHYGAPQAVRAFAEGYKLGSDGGVFGVLQDFISRVTVEKQLNSYGALFPSFYQLLPVYDENCARTGRNNLVLPKSVVSLNRQANLFSAKVWREMGWPRYIPEGLSEAEYYKLLPGFLKNAHAFLCVVSNVKFPKDVKITDFAALDHQTVTQLKLSKMPASRKPRLRGRAQAVDVTRGEAIGFDVVGSGDGDGTVPFEIAGDWMPGVNYSRYYPQETHEYLLDSALFKERINSIYRYARAQVDENLLSSPDRFERMKNVFVGLDKNIFLGIPLAEDMVVKGGEIEAVSDTFPKIIEFNKELMKARGLTKEDMLALASDEGRPQREAQALLSSLGFAEAPREDLRFIYAPWSKFCGNGKAAAGGRPCLLATEVRTEGGVPVMAASLIEQGRRSKKVMRITIPGPLQLRYGARAIIDEDQLMRAPFFTCYANACMADFPLAADIAQKLRRAQTLTVEAIALDGAAVSFHVPMASFRESERGPGADMTQFDDQEREFLVKVGSVAVAQQGDLIDVPRARFATAADKKVAVSKAMASFWAPLGRVVRSNADASTPEGQQFLEAIRRMVFSNPRLEWNDLLGLSAAAGTADNSSNGSQKRRGRPSGSRTERSEGAANPVGRQSSN